MAESNTYEGSVEKAAMYNPVYDLSNSLEAEKSVILDNSVEDAMEKRIRTESDGSMLCILSVGRDIIEVQMDEEEDAVLIDDRREPSKEDAIINLSIDSKALQFLSFFLLITLQRIPRHYSKKFKGFLQIAQLIAVLLLFASFPYELGLFGNNTLTVNQWDITVTSVKNVLSNLKFPLLYVVGIFYFRTRHLEKTLSEVRLTRRYWKHGRRWIVITIVMMFVFTVFVPVICKSTQMSLHPKSTPNENYGLYSIVSSCVLSIFVRVMSLSIVVAFVLLVYLIYYQIRFFKEQALKWPYGCKNYARDAFVNIKRMIKDAERYFQPFLIIHLSIFLTLLIPMIVSCIEQFETEGSYIQTYYDPTTIKPKLPIRFIPTRLINSTVSYGLQQATANDTHTKIDNPYKRVPQERKITDYEGIMKVILGIVADFFELMVLYSVPIVLLGKIDKCIKLIRYDIKILKFAEQKEGAYMFQTREDVDFWITELNGARGIQVLGMSMTSFRAVVITLLFPFVTVMFRIMLRQVNVTP
jgi:hypothetical protein